MKAGLSNLRIRHNTIYDLLDVANSGVRAIVIGGARTTDPDQNIVVENNLIYNIRAEDAAIDLRRLGHVAHRDRHMVELSDHLVSALCRAACSWALKGKNEREQQ